METILITGGLGFIGVNLAQYFANKGYHVICIDNLSRPGPNFVKDINTLPIKHFLPNKQPKALSELSEFSEYPFIVQFMRKNFPAVELHIQDILETSSVMKIIKIAKPSMIVHAAGQTSAIDSFHNPYSDFSVNTVGLMNILEAARQCDPHPVFLYLSTNKVYGTKINRAMIQETPDRLELISPKEGFDEITGVDQTYHTPYGVSKLAGDLFVQEYGFAYGIPVGIFRMSCIYGPFQFGFEGQGWISHMIIKALTHQPITIFGSGKQVRDILYISDLVDLAEKFLNFMIAKAQLQNQFQIKPKPMVFNVGGGLKNSISLRQLTSLLAMKMENPLHIDYKESRPGDQKLYISDISRASEVLGWEPKVSPETGIGHLFEWSKMNLTEIIKLKKC